MELVNTDVAYKFIRERILAGEYGAGMPLSSKNLSKVIGVSRTPVRDALRQLENDGLVVIRPRMGGRVRSMNLQEFKDLCGMRQALETYAAGLAAQNRTQADLEEIGAALTAMRVIVEKMIKTSKQPKGMIADLAREDIRFHLAIISVAKNDLMRKEIMRLSLINRVVTSPSLFAGIEGLETRKQVLEGHQAIFDAITRKDPTAAKETMERHLRENLQKVIQLMGVKERSKFHAELGIAS